ncbi:MAG TPA: SGNH/GDSL hydrolase family protein, partial [Vicinamibacterales bacterium]|nr:SGNH/GDSL hydrolase family protein [Vicinamibacterales bacterium]
MLPWTPARLPSSVGWYAPNRAGLADGATIANLAALSGGGPALAGTAVTVDASAALRGMPAAKFLAASSSALSASTGGVSSGAHTIAVIARFDEVPTQPADAAYLGRQYPAALSAVGVTGSANGGKWWAGHTGSLDPRFQPAQDTQPHLFVKRSTGSTVDVWIDGQHVLRASATTPAIGPGITLGGPWAAGFDGDKHLWAAAFSGAAIDLATISQIEAWAHRECGLFRLILDGDSIAYGYGAASHGAPRDLLAGWTGTNTAAAVGAAYLPSCGLSTTVAASGTTSTQILARQAAQVLPLLPGSDTSWVRGAGIPVWAVLSSGTNDLSQATSGNHAVVTAAAIANAQAYC